MRNKIRECPVINTLIMVSFIPYRIRQYMIVVCLFAISFTESVGRASHICKMILVFYYGVLFGSNISNSKYEIIRIRYNVLYDSYRRLLRDYTIMRREYLIYKRVVPSPVRNI